MITLASDFGSPYPAAMKGVMLSRAAAPRLVDVAHDLPRGDRRAAAFWLRFVLPEFPPAVHLAVVDPGVGTDRAALVVRAGEHALVGPDNGSLLPPARALADGGDVTVFEAAVDDPRSSTFHGRDVFAPTAAAVHEAGVRELETLDSLTRTDEYETLTFPNASVETDRAAGEVLVVDDFGNVVTNVPGSFLDGRHGDEVHVHTSTGDHVVPVVGTFADAPARDPLATVGSHGYVECDVNGGRGDEAFDLAPGRSVVLSFDEETTQLLPA